MSTLVREYRLGNIHNCQTRYTFNMDRGSKWRVHAGQIRLSMYQYEGRKHDFFFKFPCWKSASFHWFWSFFAIFKKNFWKLKGALFFWFFIFFGSLEGEADSNTTRETRQQKRKNRRFGMVTVRSVWACCAKINIGNVEHGAKQTRKSSSRLHFFIEKRRAGFQQSGKTSRLFLVFAMEPEERTYFRGCARLVAAP